MTRKLFISDIHGQLETFIEVLRTAQFDSDHDQLYLLGDYIYGGSKSLETLRYVRELCRRSNVIAIRGNQEQSFLDWKSSSDAMRAIDPKTALYRDIAMEEELVDFIVHLPFYADDERFIVVHAGIDPTLPDWKQTSMSDFISIRSRFHHETLSTSKPVIFGHTPCDRLHGSNDVWFGNDKIGIDGGARWNAQINCLEWDERRFRQFHAKC